MPIKWSARQVAENLDHLEKIIDEAQPILKLCQKNAVATAKLLNLPEYMKQPLMTFANDLDYFIKGCRCRIDRIRGLLPKNDLAREQRRFEQWLSLCDGDREKAEQGMRSFL